MKSQREIVLLAIENWMILLKGLFSFPIQLLHPGIATSLTDLGCQFCYL
jgi:hypothetical protein